MKALAHESMTECSLIFAVTRGIERNSDGHASIVCRTYNAVVSRAVSFIMYLYDPTALGRPAVVAVL